MRNKPIVYFDNCALERLIDKSRSPKILRQRAAVEVLLAQIEAGDMQMVSSNYQFEEASKARGPRATVVVDNLLQCTKRAVETVESVDAVDIADALRLEHPRTPWRLRQEDSFHIGSAVLRQVDYFVTCDDRVLKWAKARKRDTILGRVRVLLPQELLGSLRHAASRKTQKEEE